jgi:PAS domain S-box-containing protein
MRLTKSEIFILLAMGALSAVLFAIDASFPLGQTSAMCFVIVVGMCLWLRATAFAYLSVLTSILLTILAFLHSDPGPAHIDIMNRTGSVLAFCFVAAIVLLYKRGEISSLRANALIQSSGDGIVSVTNAGTITSWSSGAERLYGYSASEAVGRSLKIVLDQTTADRFEAILRRALSSRQIWERDTVHRHKNGTPLDASVKFFPILDTTQEIIGLGLIARDVAERKEFEQALIGAGGEGGELRKIGIPERDES